MPGQAPFTLGEAAVAVLTTAPAAAKAEFGKALAARWFRGELAFTFDVPPPDRPARPAQPELRLPRDMPKRGAGGSRENRAALLHAIAHIELNAIDLAWDIVARFGAAMPRAFSDDWVRVAEDEARHFLLLADRLSALGTSYGDLPAHDGLWQAAMATAHDLAARLAIVPMVLEARGLDVTPAMIVRLRRFGDEDSATALEVILEEEVSHVAAGRRWFDHICRNRGSEPAQIYHELVRHHFNGEIKPPFNEKARKSAGLLPEFYLPLTPAGR